MTTQDSADNNENPFSWYFFSQKYVCNEWPEIHSWTYFSYVKILLCSIDVYVSLYTKSHRLAYHGSLINSEIKSFDSFSFDKIIWALQHLHLF